MTLSVTPHLNFDGQAHAALAFYQTVFGGQLAAISYRDAGNVQAPGDADKLMWGMVAAPDGFCVMAYDVPAGTAWNAGENAFFVSLRGKETGEIARRWEGLADGAQVVRDLAPSPWAPLYGMLKDRFGITWVLSVEPANPA